MKIAAVIAEYNPLHNGHLKLLKKVKREVKPEALVVVMSGSFTERGDICVADKYTRAKWAVECGADLVIELPTVYTLSPAKSFAEGALKTLSMLGEFILCFGTETKELEELAYVAEFMRSESKDMRNMLRGYLSEGYSVARSRTMALDLIHPDYANLVKAPNNILAVEYLKAGAAYGDKVQYHSVERKPDNNRTIISSTKVRAMMQEGKDFSAFVPECVVIPHPTDMSKYGTVSTYSMRTKTAAELADIANISEGLENRISKTDFNTFEEFLRLTTKRYTRSTIKRIAASATVGITKDLVALARENKPYTTVLAANERKKKKLFALLAASDGYFYFKPSDCPADSPVRPLIDLDERAAKVLRLCRADEKPKEAANDQTEEQTSQNDNINS